MVAFALGRGVTIAVAAVHIDGMRDTRLPKQMDMSAVLFLPKAADKESLDAAFAQK